MPKVPGLGLDSKGHGAKGCLGGETLADVCSACQGENREEGVTFISSREM